MPLLRKLGDENFSGNNHKATPQHRTDQNKVVIPFLSVPLLDISTIPGGLIQIMYGNTSFEVARESNIELPDCLRLQYAFQAVYQSGDIWCTF
jgi:hypothetical protein